MKTPHLPDPAPAFPHMVSVALSQLKQRLQQDYQKAYPDSGEIIQLVLDQEEAKAREISFFPHLIMPDLVETKIAELESSGPKRTTASSACSPISL